MAPGRPGPLTPEGGAVVYWDSSAVLSVLFRDHHTEDAVAWARRPGVHLLSSLASFEVHAVIARIARERALAGALLDVARNELTNRSIK